MFEKYITFKPCKYYTMKRHYLTSLFLSFLFLISFSQEKSFEEFEEKVNKYFELDYESIFTHLNKTKYFEGEELWFKTYVYDIKRQLPFVSSTNIYTSIYNEEGALIKKKIYAALSGMTYGNFKIDSTYATGTYYFKTTTNWMKNFDQDYSHIQKFEIINEEVSIDTVEPTKATYDFQLLPEGGHIIENTINTIGFKTINYFGKTVIITSGKVIDSDKKIVAIFKSNSFGVGKFVFKPKQNKKYFTEIELENGDKLSKPILDIKSNGISLNIDNMQDASLFIRLNTNDVTLSNLIDKQYHLIIHRDGLLKKVSVNFTENKLSYLYNIERSFLNKGINIITLLNENNQPIAERVIFNHNESSAKEINISETIKTNDSTVVKLKTNQSFKNINLSVSVLPSSTKAHDRNSTIISSFLLSPYIKGSIENPWYYLNKVDRKKIYDLDLLLLTQGWSKYFWKNIFNKPPVITHNFETGFTIKGKLNNYDYKNGDKILLQSKTNAIQEEVDLNKDKVFNFNNLYLADEGPLNFTLKNKSGKLFKPNVYYNVYPAYVKDAIKINKTTNSRKTLYSNSESSFVFEDGTNMLDSIELSTSYTKPKPKNKPFGASNAKHISFADAKNFGSLITEEIRKYGYDVTNDGFNVKIVSRRVLTLKGSLSPMVMLDNMNISSQLDLISNLRIEDIEEMFVSNTSNIYASAAGVIHIFTKKGRSRFSASTYSESEIKFGFSDAKEYYTPFYNKFDNDNFNKMAVLNWIPNLTADSQGEIAFKIPNYFYDDVNLYIEGMSEDGSLFSEIITISID